MQSGSGEIPFPKNIRCGNSSVGRASASQAEGREFESRFPLKKTALAAGYGGLSFQGGKLAFNGLKRKDGEGVSPTAVSLKVRINGKWHQRKIHVDFRWCGRWICKTVSDGRDFPAKVWPMVFSKCRRARFPRKTAPGGAKKCCPPGAV